MALDFAIRSGLITALSKGGNPAIPPHLAAILQRAGVLKGAALTPAFHNDWRHHEGELTARAAFLRLAASDLAQHGDSLWTDLPAFMQRSETFAFFNYGPAANGHTDHCTQAWVAYVSALTEVEAPALLPHLALPATGAVLEIGGNSGTFARHILTRHSGLRMTVLDLPGVCRIARADPRNQALAPRLTFAAGDMRAADLATVAGGAPDVILLKSVLHDWPEAEAATLIRRALTALAPAGCLIIAERSTFEAAALPDLSMHAVANAVFSPFYRDPSAYPAMIRAHSPLARIELASLTLDMRWHVTTATVA